MAVNIVGGLGAMGLTLTDGPLAGTEYPFEPSCMWLSIPEYGQCDRPGCLAFHLITHIYWATGRKAGEWYSSEQALCPESEPVE